jgi:hypothetical protein
MLQLCTCCDVHKFLFYFWAYVSLYLFVNFKQTNNAYEYLVNYMQQHR